MNGADWVRLYTDFFDNPKIRQIKKRPQKDGDTIITIWVNLICLAGKQNRCGVFMLTDTIPYTDEMLANEIERPYETEFAPAMAVLRQYEMIIDIDGVPAIKNWGVYQQQLDTLDKQREQNRVRVQRYRDKQKEIRNNNKAVTHYNTVTTRITTRTCNGDVTHTELELEKDKEIDIEKDIYLNKKTDNYEEANNKQVVDEKSFYLNNRANGVEEQKSTTTTTLDSLDKDLDTFCRKFGIGIDNYGPRLAQMDFKALTERFEESEWLKANVTSFKKICDIYPRIISGYYKDYNRKPKGSREFDILQRMLKEAEEEEEREKQEKGESDNGPQESS